MHSFEQHFPGSFEQSREAFGAFSLEAVDFDELKGVVEKHPELEGLLSMFHDGCFDYTETVLETNEFLVRHQGDIGADRELAEKWTEMDNRKRRVHDGFISTTNALIRAFSKVGFSSEIFNRLVESKSRVKYMRVAVATAFRELKKQEPPVDEQENGESHG